jgi:hypothetical protein
MSVSLSDEEMGAPEFDNHNTTKQPVEGAPVSIFIRFRVGM